MSIVNIKIDTEHLGDTPKVQIDGHDIKVLYHIDFNWTTSKESVPSISKLNIKHLPDYMYGYHPLSYWYEHLNHLNDVVIKDFTWETALHQSVNNKDGE